MAFDDFVKNKDYYIYFLFDKNNVVRYVGRGRRRRYRDYSNRSEQYKHIVDHGGQAEIIIDNLSKAESMAIENEYLRMFVGIVKEGFNLLNKVRHNSVKELLTYEECSTFFQLDEEFPYLRYPNTSSIKPGQLVLRRKPRPYALVKIGDSNVSVTRVIWVLYNKKDLPIDLVVDHIDSDNTNDHPTNLQALTQEQNIRKSKFASKTGFVGVTLDIGRSARYVASWTVDNKQYSKSFGIGKYGEENAFKMACEYRELMQQKFNSAI